MGYEVDFLAVGEGERSGDAIALRYGNLHGPRSEQTVITIDGGTLESGDALVDHVLKHYGTNTVDVAFLTHCDNDHASGMRQVLERLKVGVVAMHLPWTHSSDVRALIDDDRVTTDSLRERTKRNLRAAKEIFDLAQAKGIKVVEPFAGTTKGNELVVLGPTEEFYQEMLANFRFMPGSESVTASASGMWTRVVEGVRKFLEEHWLNETLQEPDADATSAENNSSAIITLQVEGRKILFTGDAGVPALTAAADFAAANNVSLAGINLFHVPHHGSRRNIGPAFLNRIFGTIRPTDQPTWEAIISAGKEAAPKHPHKKVTNALRRRGAKVHVTAGKGICCPHNAPQRAGWTPVEPLPFFHQVEDDD